MSKIETPEQLAKLFHDTYERLAPEHGYKTRETSAKPWADVPEGIRNLMIATCDVVLTELLTVGRFTLADVYAGAKVFREAPTLTHADGYVHIKDGQAIPPDEEQP